MDECTSEVLRDLLVWLVCQGVSRFSTVETHAYCWQKFARVEGAAGRIAEPATCGRGGGA